jgi:hypothetical protein
MSAMTTRASAPGALPEPLGQAGPKAVGQSAAQHCAPRFLIFISFYIFRKYNTNWKNMKQVSMESLGVYLGFRLDKSYFSTLLLSVKLLQLIS